MVTRNDVIVYHELSPRLVLVQAPSTSINIQDLHDTLVELEDDFQNMSYPRLVSSSGKQDLGGGNFVGITLELQDAKLAFERRTVLRTSGTITTANDATLRITEVIDASATFVTDGVAVGDLVTNDSDDPVNAGEVVEIISETQINVLAPTGGTDNLFEIGDSYQVWEIFECNVDGGNLVAVDDAGDPITPIFPTFGTFVNRILSNSATLTNGAPDLFIEALREAVFDGQTFEDLMAFLKSWGYGKFIETSEGVFDYYDFAGTTKLFTLTATQDGLGFVTRERS